MSHCAIRVCTHRLLKCSNLSDGSGLPGCQQRPPELKQKVPVFQRQFLMTHLFHDRHLSRRPKHTHPVRGGLFEPPVEGCVYGSKLDAVTLPDGCPERDQVIGRPHVANSTGETDGSVRHLPGFRDQVTHISLKRLRADSAVIASVGLRPSRPDSSTPRRRPWSACPTPPPSQRLSPNPARS